MERVSGLPISKLQPAPSNGDPATFSTIASHALWLDDLPQLGEPHLLEMRQ
jgi:hypothetical protein